MSHKKFNRNQDQQPFKVPEAYFEQLEASISRQVNGISKTEPFVVPEGYFEQLEANILQATETPVVPFYKRFWFKPLIITAAASLALIFLIDVFQEQEKCESFACLLNSSEIQLEDIQWIETELIEEYYSETVESTQENEQNEILIDYILENDWDVETLLEDDYQ